MERKLVDHHSNNEKSPSLHESCQKWPGCYYPSIQTKKVKHVSGKQSRGKSRKQQSVVVSSYECCPFFEVEGDEDDRNNDDIADSVGSVSGEASLDEFVVVERVEEVEALKENECEHAEPKVFGRTIKKSAIVREDLAYAKIVAGSLTLQLPLFVVQVDDSERHQNEQAETNKYCTGWSNRRF